MSTERYDRQLRLWGPEGQRRVSECRVLAFGATPSTCEALKNLILGGIKSFHLVDDALLASPSRPDARARCLSELFEIVIDAEMDSTSTVAEACVKGLARLNPDVGGTWTKSSARGSVNIAESLTQSEGVDVVLVDGWWMGDEYVQELEAWALKRGDVVLATTRACGLFAECKTSANARWVMENVTPEGSVTKDLRLMNPWSELQAYVEMKTSDLDRLDAAAFKHVPFVALLASAAAQCGTSDRRAVKDALTSMRRGLDEENFDEAFANMRYAWTDTGAVTPEIEALTRDRRAIELTAESDKGWFLAAGLREFISSEGCLPLEGSIPDMISTTESYVELQRLYADKANRDACVVWQSAVERAARVGYIGDLITEQDAKTFCKHCRYVRFMTWRKMADELDPSTSVTSGTATLLKDAISDPSKTVSAFIFAAFRAASAFRGPGGRDPGVDPETVIDSETGLPMSQDTFVSRDAEVLHEHMTRDVLQPRGVKLDQSTAKIAEDVLYEYTRYGNGQLNAVGSVIGGIASQEIIKLVTRQYIPMTQRLIYDGVHSTTTLLF